MKTHLKLLFYPLFFLSCSAMAEVTTDIRITGSPQSLPIDGKGNVDINSAYSISNTGNPNLFYSFEKFNIAERQSATFINSSLPINNVISRVTGNNTSYIYGSLISKIPNANFYFINPAGVIFGSNATVNVPAAFHLSTAGQIKLDDGKEFNIATTDVSTLTANPVSFGFLDNHVGDIQIKSSLIFDANKPISVSGKDVIINNGSIINNSGNVQLYAVGDAKVDINLQKPLTETLSGTLVIDHGTLSSDKESGGVLTVNAGAVKILNQSQMQVHNKSSTNANANSGIQITANQISIDNSRLLSKTTSSGSSGNIKIDSSFIELNNNTSISISNEKTATGNEAGVIDVNSATLNIFSQSSILTNTVSSAATGAIKINADKLNIVNESQIKSSTNAGGNAGDVTVDAKNIVIDGQQTPNASTNKPFSGIFSDINKNATGHGGLVKVTSDDITLINEGTIRSRTQSLNATGRAGDVVINSKSLLIDGNGRISSDTNNPPPLPDSSNPSSDPISLADAGTIKITSDKITILNQGGITSNTFSQGNAGEINVDAHQILIDGTNSPIGKETRISTNATEKSTGNAGTVTVKTSNLQILNGGTISSSSKGIDHGNAGKVIVTADNITIDGKNNPQYTGIFSDTYSNLDANGIEQNHGNADKVNVSANSLSLLDTGKISSSTWNLGKAGDVEINVGRLLISGENTGLFAAAKEGSSGQTGSVNVTANQTISLSNHGKISIENDAKNLAVADLATITPTAITISAPDIDLKDSSITTESTGNVDAGNINLNFSHWLTMNPSFITTTANLGNGGVINIFGGELIYLQNSGFLTSVTGVGGTGNGGNINVGADTLIMEAGVIQANAVGGSGGDINLNLKTLIPSQNRLIIGGSKIDWQPFQSGLNVIQAVSETGVNGSINVSSPQFDISGSISGLDTGKLVIPNTDHRRCQPSITPRSSLARGGKGGVPLNEEKSGFIPSATELSKAKLSSEKNLLKTKRLEANTINQAKNYPCDAQTL